MKSLLQATFAAITIATLAGCAAPLPKGSDTSKYLPTPVDVSKMKPVEMILKAKNGDEYKVRRMLNEKSGEYFDTDGYSVNEQKFRVLKDGTVCQPKLVGSLFPNPFYSDIIDKSGNEVDKLFCLEKEIQDRANNDGYLFAAGGMVVITGIGGAAMAGATATGAAAGAVIEETKAAIKNNDE